MNYERLSKLSSYIDCAELLKGKKIKLNAMVSSFSTFLCAFGFGLGYWK